MGRIFDLEGPVFSFFSKLASAFWLSILWTLTSIPIITIGASNAAIYYVLLKILDEKDVKVTRQYFAAFKDNFKKATKIWVPLLLIVFVGLADIYICLIVGGTIAKVGAVLFMCAEVLLAIFGLYVFPIMGRFENNLKQTIKNGMLMPVKHYICTLWLIVIVTLVITFGVLFPPITLVLPGVMAFATSYPLFLVFKKYESDVTNPLENGILPNFEIRQLSSDQLKKFIKTPKNNEKDMSSKSGSKAKNKPKKEKKPKNNVF